MRHLLAQALLVLTSSCAAPAAPAAPPSAPPAFASARAAPTSAPGSAASLDPVYARALEGDMRAGLAALDAIPLAGLGPAQRQARACLVDRFRDHKAQAASPTPGSALLPAVTSIYRAYWSRMLLKETDAAGGETFLRTRLEGLLAAREPGEAHPTLDELLERLGKRLEAEGVHSIRGVTAPYHDLIVWRSETAKAHPITLPEGPTTVNVVLLRDFPVLGWTAYATCERSYTGGWATKDKLYCVADSYDLASENFAISYLDHEGQHFADYKRFPKLEGPELEYRAKLVELSQSKETTRDLASTFAAQSGGDRSAPHSFANTALIRDLARVLRVPVEAVPTTEAVKIRDAAAQLYRENTARLDAKGAATVTQILEP